VLAAWSLLHTRLTQQMVHCKLVVQRSAMEYEAPMSGAFTATATLVDGADWDKFIAAYQAHGKARIQVKAVLHSAGHRAGRFAGEFVALREPARKTA
jgi:thioesterase domain-containing protein